MDNGIRQPEAQSPNWFDGDSTRLIQARDQIEILQASIATMLTEIEDIIVRQNPRIESEWQIVVGVWENRLLEAQIDMRRAKRRYSLVQAKANAGTPIDLFEVEKQLDEELAEWAEQLDVAVSRYQEAVNSHEHAVHITSSEDRELKRLFRVLAKRLHPDLHPSAAESSRVMFSLAQRAYQQGDLKMLQSLEASSAHLDVKAQPPATLDEASARISTLEEQAASLKKRLEETKQQPPYSLRAKLDDTTWVNGHVAELKREIEDCRRAEQKYLDRCDEIAGNHG